MTIVINGAILQVGEDFVDAVSGKRKCHGELETTANRSRRYKWVSTLSLDATDKALRHAAGKEGFRVTYIKSQAL